ncbi:MAG: hypothetical protein JWM98_2269, partial [Thermoleophilia bacterium]|nr:hypothetical protein [Thermoleophilia bacterium]
MSSMSAAQRQVVIDRTGQLAAGA